MISTRVLAAALLGTVGAGAAFETAAQVFTFPNVIRVINNRGARAQLAPQVRITSPLNGAITGRGHSLVGAGSPLGTAFAINLEVLTRDSVGVVVSEETQTPSDPGIRNVDALGGLNPEFPGLFVFIDEDLITPTGEIIPANTNLGPLFNIAGTDDTPGEGVTIWAGWHVLESFRPGVDSFNLTAAVVDQAGRIGFDSINCEIEPGFSGNDLTPDPSTYAFSTADNDATESGPLVEIVAPRVPSAIALGIQGAVPADNLEGSLNFIQVNILDIYNGGIAVDEIGETVTRPEFGIGVIVDPLQLGAGADNRNFPGLHFSFDVPLQAPTGLLVPAGKNLAPVFNTVGSEVDPETGAVRVVADWVVGGSLVLDDPNKQFVTFTAKVTDNEGRTGVSKRTFRISEALGGNFLTPNP